ncbi:MFS general substrate transporter [Delitschia confertaspora ATCC 74209]|uniref:MFS general substrate transporter n=1 Tax=Delitschia confertaspora ATCC 74209 TaxID=1513339 RepID=A0A9P4JN66_9PLEO|nr:MFS general substrate transporter [Delitschia confertaspora ATCC 74209]
MIKSTVFTKNVADPPLGLKWRSHTIFIVCTVGIGTFTDMFLYGLIVPVLPFILKDHIHLPSSTIQSQISNLLAIYAAASMLASPMAGILADRMLSSRQLPFLLGLVLLLCSTLLLAIGRSIPVLALARFLQGASGGTVWTIGLALLTETVGQENLGKTIGTIFSFVSVAGLFSPIVGGLLYAKTGYTGVFGIGAAFVVLDFIMRLLMIEKKVAAPYLFSDQNPSESSDSLEPHASTEWTPLLSNRSPETLPELSPYHLEPPKNRLTKTLPILLLLCSPSLLTGLFLGLIQATLLGAFDATVPLVASQRYSFDSLRAGLLFLPLSLSDFLFGPVFGWAVDRWGTKPVAVAGFTFLVPVLTLLRIPVDNPSDAEMGHQIALYVSLLALNGIGLAIINSTSIVECGSVLEKYCKANPKIFAEPPYAQLYGLNSMVWSLGLTVGPLMSGNLREKVGYGDMNAVMAGVCAGTAVLAMMFVGNRAEVTREGKDREGRGGDSEEQRLSCRGDPPF